jgi:hypothetical protein
MTTLVRILRSALPAGHLLQILLIITALGAFPRVYTAVKAPLNYDEYWHLFIAKQDSRATMAAEWRRNAHPPLYFWLLKVVTSLGTGPRIDRSISLLAGLTVVFLVGRIVSRLTSSAWVSTLAALAVALSPSAIDLSSEIRSYMLCTGFLLFAFSQFLSIVDDAVPPSIFTMLLWSGGSCLALLSHYYAAFFIATCGAALLYVGAVHLAHRGDLPPGLARRWPILALLVLPVAALGMFLYQTHLRTRMGNPEGHLLAFYYHAGDSLLGYSRAAVFNLYELFSPLPLPTSTAHLLFVAAVILLGAVVVYLVRVDRRVRDIPRCMPALFLLLLTVELYVASVRGWYPFGGDLRQQFILFPFLVIALSVLLDWALVVHRIAAVSAVGLMLTGICLNVSTLSRGPASLTPESRAFATMFSREMDIYQRAFPDPPMVYLDQFSLIVFFAHHERSRWRSSGPDTYEVTGSSERFVVLRDSKHWNVDLLDDRTYADIATRLPSEPLAATTVFSLRYPIPPQATKETFAEAIQQLAPCLAARHNLQMSRVIVDGFNVFAELKRGRDSEWGSKCRSES